LAIIPADEERAGIAEDHQEIEALVARRNAARRSRDFAASDQIRQELLNRGILIEDTREGTKWRRK
jgi:cysteinyl-tRNA synthetase